MKQDNNFEVLSAEELVTRITRWIVDVIILIILGFFLTYMLGTRITMQGNSMTPTLQNDDRLLLNRFAGKLSRINRFDVVVYRLNDSDTVYMKRVLGMPGETIKIENGRVYINGEQLDLEDHLSAIASAGIAADPVTLGRDEYFVIGENADASLDSRFSDVGNISLSNILGTAWLRYSPFKNMKVIR